MLYTAQFQGRTRGAIGVNYNISTKVEGENTSQARLNLYDRFDHIHNLTLKEDTMTITRQLNNLNRFRSDGRQAFLARRAAQARRKGTS